MNSAVIDLDFQLPTARPMERPMAFTGAQLQRLIAPGKNSPEARSPAVRQILDRVEGLRGSSITWAFGLRLGDLITWSVRNARGSVAGLPAPLTFFKIEHFQWIPKVVILPCEVAQIDSRDLFAYHTTCRRGSIEFMAITQEQIDDGYLESKHFKRAFNGAFFCDAAKNSAVFCPTLRDWGFYAWHEPVLATSPSPQFSIRT